MYIDSFNKTKYIIPSFIEHNSIIDQVECCIYLSSKKSCASKSEQSDFFDYPEITDDLHILTLDSSVSFKPTEEIPFYAAVYGNTDFNLQDIFENTSLQYGIVFTLSFTQRV